MQTVPTMETTDIREYAYASNCSATFDAVVRELDRIAVAAGGLAASLSMAPDFEERFKCLYDAFAQPGFCPLVQEARRPSCMFAPDTRPTTLHVSPLPCTHAHPVEAEQRMR